MARVDLLDPNESDDPAVREFAPKVTAPDGSVGHHFAAETHFPEVMIKTYEARLALARNGDLGTELFTKLAVAISMANECKYCTGAYAKQLSPRLGSDQATREWQLAVANEDLDGEEAHIVDFALTVLNDGGAVTDADFARLRETCDFGDRKFIEVIYVVNIVSGYNRVTMATDLAYDHDYPEEWADPASLPDGFRA
jgi:alkylhydroperoxidase family enzyme